MTAAQPTHVPPPPTPPGAAPAGPARRPAGGRALTVVGGVLAALLLALGVVQVLASMFAQTTSAVATLAATDVVELVADGEVLVTVSAVDDVRVERVARFAWAGPRYEVTSDGVRTVVRHECEGVWMTTCSAGLEVTVPEGTHVVVRTTDGEVRVAGPAADVEVRASDGDVHVSGARGDLDVRGRDGDVTAQGVRGGVAVELSDGDVRVAEAGGDVAVRSRDGAVALADLAADADVRAADGQVEVRDVRGALTVRHRDGDVLVAQVRGDVTVQAADGDVTVHGTGDPVALEITSNGRQRVEGATDPAAGVRVELRTSDGDVAYLGPEG